MADRERKRHICRPFRKPAINRSAAWRIVSSNRARRLDAVAALITLVVGLVLTSRGFWKWLLVFLAIGFVWRLVLLGQ